MGIVGDEDALFLCGVVGFNLFQDFGELGLDGFVGGAQVAVVDLVGQIVFPAVVEESLDSAIGGDGFVRGGVDVDENIAVVAGKEVCGLETSHIVVRVDAADVGIFPLDGDDGDGEVSQFTGGDGVAHDDHAFYFVGEELFYVAAFDFFVFVADEYEEFVAEGLVGGQNLVKDFGIVVMVQVGDDDSDEFCLSVG